MIYPDSTDPAEAGEPKLHAVPSQDLNRDMAQMMTPKHDPAYTAIITLKPS